MSMEKLIASGVFGMMNSGTAYIIGMIVCAVLSYLIGSVNFTAIFAKKYDAFPDTMGIYKKAGAGVAFGVAALDGVCRATDMPAFARLCALSGMLFPFGLNSKAEPVVRFI